MLLNEGGDKPMLAIRHYKSIAWTAFFTVKIVSYEPAFMVISIEAVLGFEL